MAALNDPTRARLLRLIEQHELSVGEISRVLQLPQSTASRHIKVLADCAWLSSRRNGTSRLYRLAQDGFPESQKRLWSILRDSLGSGEQTSEDDSRLQSVLFDRQSKSQRFFASSAGRWDKLRTELFGREFELRLLASLLPANATICDLGCGTGRVLELLMPFAKRIIGIDGSHAMIEAARQRLRTQQHGFPENVELHHAQLEKLPLQNATADFALIVLVLHYVSDPERVLKEAARVVRPGGKLLVLDMQSHNRQEYRTQMGHLWQGFEQQQLNRWFSEAGLVQFAHTELPADRTAKGPALFISSAHTEKADSPQQTTLASR